MLHAMQWHGAVPGTIAYSALISACEKGPKPQHAPQMLQRGLLRNVITYNAATSAGE